MQRINTSIPATSEEQQNKRFRYYEFMISEANSRLVAAQGKLVFLRKVAEVDAYIQQHQHLPRIGFIVEKPDCIKSTDPSEPDTHVSPIYFERTQTGESFAQLDSALGQFFLLADSDKISRRLFYSPHLRQAKRQGCFEDTVLILMKLLQSTGLLSYCEKNSYDNTDKLTLPLTPEETKDYHDMELQSTTTGLPYYFAAKFSILARRQEYQKQLADLQKSSLKPIKFIYTLTGLPKILIPHIERFDTMRNIRVSQTEQFSKKLISGQTLLDFLMSRGVIRNHTVSKAELAANLSVSDPKYDFAGRDFLARRQEFRTAQTERSKNIYRLFYKKATSARIANRISEFATGIRPE